MIKRFAMALAVALGLSLALAVPAAASVPEWDVKGTVHSAAEWDAIKTVFNRPEDKAFFAGSPISPLAQQRKDAGDCPPIGSSGNERLCLWNGYSYGGTLWQLPILWLYNGDPSGNGLSFTGSGINNTSKGWWNRSYQSITLYDNAVCQNSGFIRDMVAGQFAVSDNAASNDWENRFSAASYYIVKGYACTSDPYN